jgi:Domain of Unknown Function with PDB structure (DUF3861)
MMKGHRYRITVEHLATPSGEPLTKPPLVFETTNHDDLFVIVERMRMRADIPAQDVEPLAIGLKLLSEVVLKHRKSPLFVTLHEALGAFIGKLKGEGGV